MHGIQNLRFPILISRFLPWSEIKIKPFLILKRTQVSWLTFFIMLGLNSKSEVKYFSAWIILRTAPHKKQKQHYNLITIFVEFCHFCAVCHCFVSVEGKTDRRPIKKKIVPVSIFIFACVVIRFSCSEGRRLYQF